VEAVDLLVENHDGGDIVAEDEGAIDHGATCALRWRAPGEK
jgi:hypothetical protein